MAKVSDKAIGESLPVQLTPKQEAFARAYVEIGNASEAYRLSYNCKPDIKPETVWVKACELLAHGKVSERVAELKLALSEKHDVTIDYLTAEYREAMDLAKSTLQPSALVAAVTALGKLHGLIVDKAKDRGDGVTINLVRFSEDRPDPRQIKQIDGEVTIRRLAN